MRASFTVINPDKEIQDAIDNEDWVSGKEKEKPYQQASPGNVEYASSTKNASIHLYEPLKKL